MKKTKQLVAARDARIEVTVKVQQWLVTAPVSSQYIEHPRSFWLIWNYLRKVGPVAVFRKLRSRLSEQRRNQKICGIGVGEVIEAPESNGGLVGSAVLFFAPNHNPQWQFVNLHIHCIAAIQDEPQPSHVTETCGPPLTLPAALLAFAGWSPFSGLELNRHAIQRVLRPMATRVELTTSATPVETVSLEPTTCLQGLVSRPNAPRAVLFGLGNYAKTAILPNIRPHIWLDRVHEIDPDQLAFFGDQSMVALCTSATPRDSQFFDAWFIAGYHHTHVDLALTALRQGATAVIEKPLATTMDQFNIFVGALDALPDARFFICFQKRYSELHEWLRQDLTLGATQGVDMHCIVYEIPLPDLHWYNWPNSGSRLVSNGCHWIDYFLFVNDYEEVAEYRVWNPRGSDLCVNLRLVSGAYFSMTLTDTGSQRLGVREYIELRQNGVTITMLDGAYYKAENRQRVLRQRKVNPLNAIARMYRQISRAIVAGAAGDSRKSLLSSELTLRLEQQLALQRTGK
jgi:predicted dehydrogenase